MIEDGNGNAVSIQYLNDLLASTTVKLVSHGWDGSGPGPCGYYGMSLANRAGMAGA
jgi:hypothetical protein